MIERFCIIFQGQIVNTSNIPDEILANFSTKDLKNTTDTVEKYKIIKSLENNKGIESRAAKEINMSLSTFRRKIKKHRIKSYPNLPIKLILATPLLL